MKAKASSLRETDANRIVVLLLNVMYRPSVSRIPMSRRDSFLTAMMLDKGMLKSIAMSAEPVSGVLTESFRSILEDSRRKPLIVSNCIWVEVKIRLPGKPLNSAKCFDECAVWLSPLDRLSTKLNNCMRRAKSTPQRKRVSWLVRNIPISSARVWGHEIEWRVCLSRPYDSY